jgi:hypothetical protein
LDHHGGCEVGYRPRGAQTAFLSASECETADLLERDADLVSAYPNDPATPDHTISFGHQLKPIWNIGRIGNSDCSSVDRDVPYPTTRARSIDRNKRRFVDLGTRMPASLVHIPIGTSLVSKVKPIPVVTDNKKPPDSWVSSSGLSHGQE